jgi:hypothetical protein
LSDPAGHREIEGYGDATSVDRGDQIRLYVNTRSKAYTLEVFRMGWYQGLGGRRVFGPISLPGVRQTTPEPDPQTGLVDANWIEPFVLTTADPADQVEWTSGVFLAKLTESVQGKQSYIIFVVRDDDRSSDLRFQLPVTTYQAYNFWGGRSLYDWNSGDGLPWASTEGTAAVKVSFNRPYVASPNPKAAYGVGAAEIIPLNAQSRPIDPSDFSVRFVDSEELIAEDGAAANALDGKARSFWHTRWKGRSPAHPHEIEIDLGAPHVLSGFRYLPRQDKKNQNGTIKAFEFHVSADCTSWDLAAQGEWAANGHMKEVRFKP